MALGVLPLIDPSGAGQRDVLASAAAAKPPTATETPVPPTATPPPPEDTATPTATPEPPTPTPEPPTATATATASATATATLAPPSATNSPTASATATVLVATPTLTPTPTPSLAVPDTVTPEATITATATISVPEVLPTATETAAVTATATSTATATPSPTATETPPPTSTPLASPTPEMPLDEVSPTATAESDIAPIVVVEAAPPLPSQTDGAGTIPLTWLHLPPEVVEPGILLPVPYRSQLDNSLYAQANCGPATLGMILDAYGIHVPTRVLRDEANRRQRSFGYDDGVAAGVLRAIAQDYGLEVFDLYDGRGYKVWTPEDIRAHLQMGRPVMTLVKYRTLPGNDRSRSESNHYIVITGISGRNFIFNDSAFVNTSGYGRLISPENLVEAWDLSDIPRQAMAFGPPRARPPLDIEPINGLDDVRRLLPLTAVIATGRGASVAEAAELTPMATPAATEEPAFPRVERRPRPTWTPTVAPAVENSAAADGEPSPGIPSVRQSASASAPVTVLRVLAEWLRVLIWSIDRVVGREPIDGW